MGRPKKPIPEFKECFCEGSGAYPGDLALEELYEKLSKRIGRYARKYAGSDSLAGYFDREAFEGIGWEAAVWVAREQASKVGEDIDRTSLLRQISRAAKCRMIDFLQAKVAERAGIPPIQLSIVEGWTKGSSNGDEIERGISYGDHVRWGASPESECIRKEKQERIRERLFEIATGMGEQYVRLVQWGLMADDDKDGMPFKGMDSVLGRRDWREDLEALAYMYEIRYGNPITK